jgi:hypothetical protein
MNKNLQQKLLNSGRSLHERRVIKKMIMEKDDTGPKTSEEDPKKKLEAIKGDLEKYSNTNILPETLKKIYAKNIKAADESLKLEPIDFDKESEELNKSIIDINKRKDYIYDFFKRAIAPGREKVLHNEDELNDFFTRINSKDTDGSSVLSKALNGDKTGNYFNETRSLLLKVFGFIKDDTKKSNEYKNVVIKIFEPFISFINELNDKKEKSKKLDPSKIAKESQALIEATKEMFNSLDKLLNDMRLSEDAKHDNLLSILGRTTQTTTDSSPAKGDGAS